MSKRQPQGDAIDVRSARYQTTTYSTAGFNGFTPLDAYYLSQLMDTQPEET